MIFLRLKWFLLLCVAVALAAGCAGATPMLAPTPTPERAAYWPSEGWRKATPEEQGMDSGILTKMLDIIQEHEYEIDSVSIIRNGHIVLDATVHPFRPGSRHVVHSCAKSIISALIGIAIDRGYIEDVEQPILAFFPERSAANLDPRKEAITLEHVLTMSTGLACRDSYLYRWDGLNQMRQNQDWVQFMLDLPMSEAPGTRFEYCNGASFLLSAIIKETTGMNALAFAKTHLFGPLGISEVVWPSNPRGITIGWGELRMLPHDMARIGYLYLNEGLWDGRQVVSSAWVEASTRRYISATLMDGYGYQWWVDSSGVYMALGYAGQFIFVVPDKEMLVVFTSDLSESDFYVPRNLLNDFIIPAARSSERLPEDPDDVGLLESRIEALANP